VGKFKLGTRSLAELEPVHPDVQDVVHSTIDTTPCDFSVFDGIRTDSEQAEYVRLGVSKTLKSKHLLQPDGFGHAVDLVPYINGKLRWETRPLILIAGYVHDAAEEHDVDLRWGAVWDRAFRDLDRDDLEAEVEAYIERRREKGKRAFLDYPHWELVT